LLHDEIVTRKTKKTPAEILLYLQDGIRSILRQDKKKNRDGMDISLCYFELLENEVFIRFAGAKTAIYAFDGSQLTDIKGERKHLGGGEDFVHFENRDFRFAKPLTLYLATDGYKDQSDFERKRIGTTGFKQILTEAVCLDFDSQKEFFERKLDAHQGDEEQRDDISLIALKF
jgi:serine phosphatase RsbU (regulator of sigma subunit)